VDITSVSGIGSSCPQMIIAILDTAKTPIIRLKKLGQLVLLIPPILPMTAIVA